MQGVSRGSERGKWCDMITFFVLYMYKISKHLKRINIQFCVPIYFLRAKTPTTNAVGLNLHLAQVGVEKLLSASLLTTDPASTYFTVHTFQVADLSKPGSL